MPIVTIDIYEGYNDAYKEGIFTGIHKALVDSFKIPEGDRNQIIREHKKVNFERSEGKSEKFIIIEIKAFLGRTREAKRKLYKNIIFNLSLNPGIEPKDVLITIIEPELLNWGVGGGMPADEIDLGFKINV